MSRIKLGYERAQDLTKPTDIDLEEDIYWISLCRNFRLERTRLAYKNIFNLIKKNFYLGLENITKNSSILSENFNTVKSRADYYIKKYSNLSQSEFPKCKISLEHKFKNKQKKNCSILGELDIIVWDEDKKTWTLIDFKCSESEYKLEWELQLLTYYSLIRMGDIYPNISIGQIGIINLLDGKEYYLDISDSYDFIELIEFYEEKIQLDQLSIRPKPDLDYIIQTNSSNNNILQSNFTNQLVKHKSIIYNGITNKSSDFIMVLDTETTDFAGDIIQISWIISNPNDGYKIIKKSNRFIKDRIPSTKSSKIHNISVDKLRTDGIDFYLVMKEFIKDLETVNKIIGHNISFDLRMIVNNLRKFNINIGNCQIGQMEQIILNIFDKHDIICTKKMSGGKSLENLYVELFGTKFTGAHDAMVDVESTLKCYIQLKEHILKNIKQTMPILNDFIV